MSSRWWIVIFVSRRFGFTLLPLPLSFVWGGRPRG
jgi:hypothetical protein